MPHHFFPEGVKMKMFGVLLLLSCLLSVLSNPLEGIVFQNKCIESLDCFYTGPPFYHPIYRPISLPPSSHLGTKFLLYSRRNSDDPIVLEPTEDSLNNSTLDSHIDTKILIHGFLTRLKKNDVRFKIKNGLLNKIPCNVIIVDWTDSNKPPYPQAVANGRAVAAQVAKFINFHVKNRGLDPKSVHCIGHSIGAHICGWMGERVPGVSRISALDPAGEYFQHAENEVRLDTTDADFVDVIHTNGGNNSLEGNGILQPIGHLDFYPNGGRKQPRCSKLKQVIKGNDDDTAQWISRLCDHSRAYFYFLYSISSCQFIGVQCSSYKDFKNKECTRENSVIAEMGYHSIKIETPPNETSFFLDTSGKSPFCNNSSKV